MKASQSAIRLHSFWQSSASWRVRTALALKGIKYEYVAVDLAKRNQLSSEYSKISPMRQVPALEIDGKVLAQSLPIIEYLEETRPNLGVKLLPTDPYTRFRVRQLAETVNSGIQPLGNSSVLNRLSKMATRLQPSVDTAALKAEWGAYWITYGFQAVEQILRETAGQYCVGDSITMADVFLVPQANNAGRFKADMAAFPLIRQITARLLQHPAFIASHPNRQPDASDQPDHLVTKGESA